MLKKITTFAALCLSLTSASNRFDRDRDMDDDFGFDVANDNAEGHHAICAIVTDDGGKFFFGFTQDDEDQVEIVGRGVEISEYYLSQEEIDYIPYRLSYDGIVVADTFIKRIHEGGKA